MHKRYTFNNKIPHYLCLYEICVRNVSFLFKEPENVSKRVQIPTDPSDIVETYSCNDVVKGCMLGNCNACQSHGLSETDFIPERNVSSDSNSDSDTRSDVTIKFYHRHKSENGCLWKMQMTFDMSDALDRWKDVVTNVKKHIFSKGQQQSPYVNIRENFGERKLPKNLHFSKNYSSRNQNEMSA